MDKLGARQPLPKGSDEVEGVFEALRSLPTRQRAAIALHYLDGYSIADIAMALGCAQGTVKAHLHKGRRALARKLGEGARGMSLHDRLRNAFSDLEQRVDRHVDLGSAATRLRTEKRRPQVLRPLLAAAAVVLVTLGLVALLPLQDDDVVGPATSRPQRTVPATVPVTEPAGTAPASTPPSTVPPSTIVDGDRRPAHPLGRGGRRWSQRGSGR